MKLFLTLCASVTALLPPMKAVCAQGMADFHHSANMVNAADFLGAGHMESAVHRVLPLARADGVMLTYMIETPWEVMTVVGTEQARERIKEIKATAILQGHSTVGAAFNAATARAVNVVETPIRAVQGLGHRASQIDNVGDAIFFVPEQAVGVGGALLNGVSELGVTGRRLTRSTTGVKCVGLDCIEEAGREVWSGWNSIVGKHKAARHLHERFGTDPETQNTSYRRQIDRLAYTTSYVSTGVKFGIGAANLDYISPAFSNVGYYNNGEFVAQYQDAHRKRNFERHHYYRWGVSPAVADAFFKSKAFTKLQRRRVFIALSTIPDAAFRQRYLNEAVRIDERLWADKSLATLEYIARLSLDGRIQLIRSDGVMPMIILTDQTLVVPVSADYLNWSPAIGQDLEAVSVYGGNKTIHVLGRAAPDFRAQSQGLGFDVVELTRNN